MKSKKLSLFLIGILLLPLLITNVYASTVPYQWIAGGEKVNVGSPNKAGTATLEKDGKKITLHLNNYNGGELKLDCYGSGQSGIILIIDLSGNNVITTSDIGIDSSNKKIEFIGTGDLTINAANPISYESFTNKVYIDPTNNKYGEEKEEITTNQITTNETEESNNDEVTSAQDDSKNNQLEEDSENKETTKTNDTSDETTKESSNDNIKMLTIAFALYAIISMGLIIFLITKVTKKPKNEVAK